MKESWLNFFRWTEIIKLIIYGYYVSDLGHIPLQAAAVAAAVIVILRIILREDIVNHEINRILNLVHDPGRVLVPVPIHVLIHVRILVQDRDHRQNIDVDKHTFTS